MSLKESILTVIVVLICFLLQLLWHRAREHSVYRRTTSKGFFTRVKALVIDWQLPGREKDYEKLTNFYLSQIQEGTLDKDDEEQLFHYLLKESLDIVPLKEHPREHFPTSWFNNRWTYFCCIAVIVFWLYLKHGQGWIGG